MQKTLPLRHSYEQGAEMGSSKERGDHFWQTLAPYPTTPTRRAPMPSA